MSITEFINILQKNLPDELENFFYSDQDISLNQLQKLKDLYPKIPWNHFMQQRELRRRALTKFSYAQNLLYTPKGLEQSSSEILADYHAEKSKEAKSIADLCCGIGSDVYKMAHGKEIVYAIDLDSETLACTKYNLRTQKNIEYLNQRAEDFDKKVDLIFADPDRRPSQRRTIDPEEMSPPLSALIEMYTEKALCDTMMIKLAPAIDYEKLEENVLREKAKEYDFCWEWEFISERGVLKEALLILSKGDKEPIRHAILLPIKREITGTGKEKIETSDWKKFLFEPDNAIIRAHLVQRMGELIDYTLLDPHIALLTSDLPGANAFGRVYRVIEVFKWNRKYLQKYIKQNKIGELIIKTKGFSQTTEELHKKFKLKGKNKLTIIIVRIGESHQAAILKEF